ncbi:MAG: DUF3298 domain-containing protein [Candidatus Hydrogenedens sp.]|nr:DUF3298 domain-containing protein [Candidatus Hydrogenedens sp.]
MRYFFLLVPMLLLAPKAPADQFQIIGQDTLEAVEFWLPMGQAVRTYCAPCGDETWTEQIIATMVPRDVDDEQLELIVNGAPIDLAYTYAPIMGEWRNVALQANLPAEDVPAVLDPMLAPAPGGFSEVQFRGGIGEKLKVTLNLALSAGKLTGTYAYDHIGTRIPVVGEVDPGTKQFTLKEYADGLHSGTFTGDYTRNPLAFEGTWSNPEGDKALPFKAAAYATPVVSRTTGEGGGMHFASAWSYPVLMLAGAPHAEALNTAIADAYDETYRAYRDSWASLPAEDFLADWDDPPLPMRSYDQSIGEYQITLHDDRFFSMIFTSWEYTGGAHGNSYYIALNLRTPDDGDPAPLELGDVIDPSEESMKVVSDYLIADLKKQEASSVASGATTAFTADDLPVWTLSRKGITFHFAPYAVASYAEGTFEVLVPWEVLGTHAKIAVE